MSIGVVVWKKRAQYLESIISNFELNNIYILKEYQDMFNLSKKEIVNIRLRSFKQIKNAHAKEIKSLKKNMRILNPFNPSDMHIKKRMQIKLAGRRRQHRIYHILYCIARGRTLETIEKNTKCKLDWEKITNVVDVFKLRRFENIDDFLKTQEEESN